MTSVPYAFKAAGAATLGGLPASAFALAGSKSVIAPAIGAPAEVVAPESGSLVDVNGSMILRGTMTGARAGNATPTQGYPSISMAFFANAYNSNTRATDNRNLQF